MLIEVQEGRGSPQCTALLVVGSRAYRLTAISRAELKAGLDALAEHLKKRRPFTAEFADEPLFNVEFSGDTFTAHTWRPKVQHPWLGWLGSRKLLSEAENVEATIADLEQASRAL